MLIGTRRLACLLAASAVGIGAVVTLAWASGPGGWDHLGDHGTPGTIPSTSSPPRWR